ncbi:Glycoside hydrolase family 125 protein [Plasmodiophora brassicae]
MRLLGVVLVGSVLAGAGAVDDDRPAPEDRRFVSDAVEKAIHDIAGRMRDRVLARIFTNCLPNTLDTTVLDFNDDTPSTFVITGDIEAMWLRDSTNQVLPYTRFAREDGRLRRMLCGVIQRQAEMVVADPYANAFNANASGHGWSRDQRRPPMSDIVFEGKYELDSLAAVLKLANQYYASTSDRTCFTLNDNRFLRAATTIVDTITNEQSSTANNVDDATYLFQRETTVATDTLMLQGRGAPGKRTGMSKCYFRPSDDSNTFPFSIPSNAMACVELRKLSALLLTVYGDNAEATRLASRAVLLSGEIADAIDQHGTVQGQYYAYEVDGFGNYVFMDDANIPSLLSLPLLGFVTTQSALYKATRARVLSSHNPYWFSGSAGAGVGGPHVGMGQIWPMGIIVQALTSDDDEEIATCLQTLRSTTAGTFFMHESFDKDDCHKFSRPWFSWANSLFGELILRLADEKPHLIFATERLVNPKQDEYEARL